MKEEFAAAGKKAAGAVKRGKPLAGRSATQVANAATRVVGKTLDAAADAFASLFDPIPTPQQQQETSVASKKREAEAEATIDFTRYTAELTRQRQQQREEARRREEHERER